MNTLKSKKSYIMKTGVVALSLFFTVSGLSFGALIEKATLKPEPGIEKGSEALVTKLRAEAGIKPLGDAETASRMAKIIPIDEARKKLEEVGKLRKDVEAGRTALPENIPPEDLKGMENIILIAAPRKDNLEVTSEMSLEKAASLGSTAEITFVKNLGPTDPVRVAIEKLLDRNPEAVIYLSRLGKTEMRITRANIEAWRQGIFYDSPLKRRAIIEAAEEVEKVVPLGLVFDEVAEMPAVVTREDYQLLNEIALAVRPAYQAGIFERLTEENREAFLSFFVESLGREFAENRGIFFTERGFFVTPLFFYAGTEETAFLRSKGALFRERLEENVIPALTEVPSMGAIRTNPFLVNILRPETVARTFAQVTEEEAGSEAVFQAMVAVLLEAKSEEIRSTVARQLAAFVPVRALEELTREAAVNKSVVALERIAVLARFASENLAFQERMPLVFLPAVVEMIPEVPVRAVLLAMIPALRNVAEETKDQQLLALLDEGEAAAVELAASALGALPNPENPEITEALIETAEGLNDAELEEVAPALRTAFEANSPEFDETRFEVKAEGRVLEFEPRDIPEVREEDFLPRLIRFIAPAREFRVERVTPEGETVLGLPRPGDIPPFVAALRRLRPANPVRQRFLPAIPEEWLRDYPEAAAVEGRARKALGATVKMALGQAELLAEQKEAADEQAVLTEETLKKLGEATEEERERILASIEFALLTNPLFKLDDVELVPVDVMPAGDLPLDEVDAAREIKMIADKVRLVVSVEEGGRGPVERFLGAASPLRFDTELREILIEEKKVTEKPGDVVSVAERVQKELKREVGVILAEPADEAVPGVVAVYPRFYGYYTGLTELVFRAIGKAASYERPAERQKYLNQLAPYGFMRRPGGFILIDVYGLMQELVADRESKKPFKKAV